MNEQPEKHCTLDLDTLRFDELGRSRVTGTQQLQSDPATSFVAEPVGGAAVPQ